MVAERAADFAFFGRSPARGMLNQVMSWPERGSRFRLGGGGPSHALPWLQQNRGEVRLWGFAKGRRRNRVSPRLGCRGRVGVFVVMYHGHLCSVFSMDAVRENSSQNIESRC